MKRFTEQLGDVVVLKQVFSSQITREQAGADTDRRFIGKA
jgi:hypothetical protein